LCMVSSSFRLAPYGFRRSTATQVRFVTHTRPIGEMRYRVQRE
jgi:hypothetical protein